MEQTTLQQRIEERAKKQLERELVDASNQMREIAAKFNFKSQLNATWYGSTYGSPQHIHLHDDFTKDIYAKCLPKYIEQITDEILQKIDEIDYLVKEKSNVNDEY